MTAPLRLLSSRGRALLIAGAVGVGIGWGMRQPAVVTVAILLLLVPVLGLISVHRSRFLLGAARDVTPTELPFGGDGEVTLTIENGSRLTTGALLIEDRLPDALGRSPRILLDRVSPRSRRTVRYPIHGHRRGLVHVGPVDVLVTDPFGMATRTQSFTSITSILVAPRIVPLRSATASLTSGGRGDTQLRAIAARGDDDLLPREHRPGDDMRRIHWRATARQGSLMVRREEVSWHSSITVVLDDRSHAHEGAGPHSTFEWAVSAAASVALHHLALGWRVLAVAASGSVLAEAAGTSLADRQAMLRAFAEAHLREASMADTLGLDVDGATAVVAVMGHLGDDGIRALARPLSSWAGCLLLDPGPVDMMAANGWRAAGWVRSTDVAEAWLRIAPASSPAAAVGARR